MDWKKFRKDHVSLNYTVMLLPHSQKKPIHFKTPVWVFGMIFLVLLILIGSVLFFAGSSHQLRQVSEEKRQLELEWQQLNVEKQQMEEQFYTLQQAADEQAKELEGLEQKTDTTLKELEKLYTRESEIRSQIGLEPPGPTDQNPDNPGSVSDASSLGLFSASRTGRNENNIEIIKNNLNLLQLGVAKQSEKYDDLSTQIQAAKDAAIAEKNQKADLRASIVRYALQFVGNRYVYGGNDPYTGVDCSGFTRYVMNHAAGISLNRTSSEQSSQGVSISASEARPGDLVFYGDGAGIDHVAIYIGNGQIVHASSARTGIKTSNWNYRTPVKIKNVLGD